MDGLEAQGREEEGKGILSSPPNLQGATSNAFPIQPDDPYRSDDDSDSNEEEYKEARREVVSEEEVCFGMSEDPLPNTLIHNVI